MDFARNLGEGIPEVVDRAQRELEVHQQRIAGYISELRPRKRIRRDEPTAVNPKPTMSRVADRRMPFQTAPLPTPDSLSPSRATISSATYPTTTALLGRDSYDAGSSDSLVLDTSPFPSFSVSFTGTTPPASLQPNHGSTGIADVTSTAAASLASGSAGSTQQQGGLDGKTEAIVIAVSIGGAVILVALIVLVSICLKRRKPKEDGSRRLRHIAEQQRSMSSLHSESSELEKQSLMRLQTASASPASSSRDQFSPSITPHRGHPGPYYKTHLPQIPESPLVGEQPVSPSSLYDGIISPTRPNRPVSPLRPPPLVLTNRRGSDSGPLSAVLPSPQAPLSKNVRLPIFSAVSSNIDSRHMSVAKSLAASSTYSDDDVATLGRRRSMESDTLPKPVGYRDSLWSVAASSYWAPRQSTKFKSGYGDWNGVGGNVALNHTRSIGSRSSGVLHEHGHRRGQESFDTGYTTDNVSTYSTNSVYSAMPGNQDRTQSGVFRSGTVRGHETLIPEMPPIPTAQELQQQYGHKQHASVSSELSEASSTPQLKSRLHSFDFWTREEREMRLGSFQPVELEGSSPRPRSPPVIVASVEELEGDSPLQRSTQSTRPTTAGSGLGLGEATMNRVRRQNDSFLTVEIGESDSRAVWDRTSSRHGDSSRNSKAARASSSTVATVFRAHPGDAVIF